MNAVSGWQCLLHNRTQQAKKAKIRIEFQALSNDCMRVFGKRHISSRFPWSSPEFAFERPNDICLIQDSGGSDLQYFDMQGNILPAIFRLRQHGILGSRTGTAVACATEVRESILPSR